jgi:flagellar biosynthetic protein FliR
MQIWIASFLWPLTRILGLLAAAPLFGNVSIPAGIKIVLGVLLALIIAPTVPALPAMDPMSLQGLLILAQQFVIGTAMGVEVAMGCLNDCNQRTYPIMYKVRMWECVEKKQ